MTHCRNPNPSCVGLQLIARTSTGESNHIVVKSKLKPLKPDPISPELFCYLHSCHLCNKKLSLQKDVYMYRGDLGFCSMECRNRQIWIDEKRELEICTKEMIDSYRRCNSPERNDWFISINNAPSFF